MKTKAKFVIEVTVIDPDTNNPVGVSIYKEEGGGMMGVDSSYIEQDVGPVTSPHGNGKLKLIDD
jgi:hypothetical protein